MKEQKQNISKEFIQECFTALFPVVGLQNLIELMEANEILLARAALHDIVTTLKPEYEEILDDGERVIYNGKVKRYQKADIIYNKLLTLIESENKVSELIFDRR